MYYCRPCRPFFFIASSARLVQKIMSTASTA